MRNNQSIASHIPNGFFAGFGCVLRARRTFAECVSQRYEKNWQDAGAVAADHRDQVCGGGRISGLSFGKSFA